MMRGALHFVSSVAFVGLLPEGSRQRASRQSVKQAYVLFFFGMKSRARWALGGAAKVTMVKRLRRLPKNGQRARVEFKIKELRRTGEEETGSKDTCAPTWCCALRCVAFGNLR